MSLYAVKNDEGKWLGCEIYCDEPDWFDHGGFIWDTRSIAEENVKLYGGHVVELVEARAKIVVSEDEAEMLEQAKCDEDPAELLVGFVNSRYKYDEDGDAEDRLMRAYVNGWTVEKTKRWNVKVPHINNGYYCKDSDGLAVFTANRGRILQERSQFTLEEIEHYGLQDCEKTEVPNED